MQKENRMCVAVRLRLQELLQQGYKEFSQGLIPTNKNVMLGVKIPLLRKLAGEVAKGDWRALLAEYEREEPAMLYYEEVMLWGMVVARAKMELPERLERVERFVPMIDNWAVCDIFCGDSKWADKAPEAAWELVERYIGSRGVFEIRFGVIMMLSHFLIPGYIGKVLKALDGIERARGEKVSGENYYVEMAVAWCLATAAVKFREETFEYLGQTNLSEAVLKKTAQKMRDSFRVSSGDKELVTRLVTEKSNNLK